MCIAKVCVLSTHATLAKKDTCSYIKAFKSVLQQLPTR